ncbi:RHS repeat-associated core domain-containing protein [Bradyrhizobium sp. SSUT77]|uniref:RHS repeat-associated core domain-containing protein n=1 Tax=Bradyrhizobium sp. SSUT77 TaxID=3040603 RepID=UPI00244A7C2F|nr:RHS repeat-associated core domain-containing protein [Bradyrhizobium sp. SSUT77]MDH2346721.1 RHS repeat-associated core domain-containing protein [Bradyrhizobium sp. SSUT77]
MTVAASPSGPYVASYSYDAMNRPISVNWTPAPAQAAPTASSVTFGHSYNKANQRVGQTATDNTWLNYPPAAASTTNYAADPLNRYTTVGAVTPTYDGNSNLTSDGAFTLGYDAENRLVSASGAGNTATYAFDAQGRRKTKTVNGTTTVFVTDADNREVLEYDGSSGAVLRWYAYGLGPNAVLNQMNVAAATRTTLVPDMLGSIVGSLDSSATSLGKVGYLPYGKSGSAGPFGFTGQRIDLEAGGLYYYRARHYSPAWGRFLQVDPIGYSGSAGLYRYAANDPLNLTDPTGLFWTSVQSYFTQTTAPELAQSQAVTDFVQQYPTAAKIEGAIGLGVPLGIAGAGALGAFGAGAEATTVWNLGSAARGRAIEQALGQNLPGNYPVIDSYVSGVATSIKSIDLGAATYQNVASLTNTLNGYVNSIANFAPVNWGAAQLAGSPITARILTLATPSAGTAVQQNAISQVIQSAASRGVTVNPVIFP